MKILFTTLTLLLLISTYSSAGTLVKIESSEVQEYKYTHGSNCDSILITVKEKTYTARYCSAQAIVEADFNMLLSSPLQSDCIKYEDCNGYQCYREYGIRTETSSLLLFVDKQNKIETYKIKQQKGPCL